MQTYIETVNSKVVRRAQFVDIDGFYGHSDSVYDGIETADLGRRTAAVARPRPGCCAMALCYLAGDTVHDIMFAPTYIKAQS